MVSPRERRFWPRAMTYYSAHVAGFSFMVELGFLDGRAALDGYDIDSLIEY